MKPLIVAADHPMLPGHFPGRPIVPGAYLLAWVIAQAHDWLTAHGPMPSALPFAVPMKTPMRVAGVRSVKFLRPIAPGQEVSAEFSPAPDALKFSLRAAGERCAVGVLELEISRTDGHAAAPARES